MGNLKYGSLLYIVKFCVHLSWMLAFFKRKKWNHENHGKYI